MTVGRHSRIGGACGAALGSDAVESVDDGVSGSKESRPPLDAMLAAATRRRVTWWPSRSSTGWRAIPGSSSTSRRSSKRSAWNLAVLDQAIDTTPSGRLLFHVLAAIAEFERDLIKDRSSLA
jgi:DNA invertase Pin-like site-specific DNA recombinase